VGRDVVERRLVERRAVDPPEADRPDVARAEPPGFVAARAGARVFGCPAGALPSDWTGRASTSAAAAGTALERWAWSAFSSAMAASSCRRRLPMVASARAIAFSSLAAVFRPGFVFPALAAIAPPSIARADCPDCGARR
jgi:hypothetical protein